MADTPRKPIAMVVRRGALKRFDVLKRKTADLPVIVTWDRRIADRRQSEAGGDDDRRQGDRRKAPGFTWDLADFVVVEEEDSTPDA